MGFAVVGEEIAGGGDGQGGVVVFRWRGRAISCGAGGRGRDCLFGIADADDAVETAGGGAGPGCGGAGGGRFEVGGYGGQGGEVVACGEARVSRVDGWSELKEKVRNDLPVKASSGRTRRSRSEGLASERRASAREMLAESCPSSGENWRMAMRMDGHSGDRRGLGLEGVVAAMFMVGLGRGSARIDESWLSMVHTGTTSVFEGCSRINLQPFTL